MSREPLVYIQNRFVPAAQAALPFSDLGFVWGATVTDRMRTFRQKLFRLDDHLRRFRTSCERAFIPLMKTDRELSDIAEELAAANSKLIAPEEELSLVMFATPGDGAGEPTLGVQTARLDFEKYARLIRHGANLEPLECANAVDPAIKHRSRLAWWIAGKRLPAGQEALFTSEKPDCFVRETAVANFLAVIDGELISPPVFTILGGISLQVVKELAERLDMRFCEREITIDEVVDRAGECLLTNSSYCLAPVATIAGAPKTIAGPILQRLVNAWSDLVGLDILHQFLTKR